MEVESPREYKIAGERTIDFFVKFGARLIERQNHDTGSAVAMTVRRLSMMPQWQKAVTSVILGRLAEMQETVQDAVGL